MTAKTVQIMNVVPSHPGRGEPSRITAYVLLEYIKSQPLASQELTEDAALKLASQILAAVMAVRTANRTPR